MSITVITGPPGAGKTTVADALVKSSPLGVHLVADQCFHWITSGYVSPWLADAHPQNTTVTGVIGAAAARYAEGGYDVVVDGIVGPWFLELFQEAIGGAAGALHYVVLRPSREVTLERAIGRPRAQDLVDPHPIRVMYDAFEDVGPFEAHVIDSSDQDLAVTVATVRRGLDRGLFALPPSRPSARTDP